MTEITHCRGGKHKTTTNKLARIGEIRPLGLDSRELMVNVAGFHSVAFLYSKTSQATQNFLFINLIVRLSFSGHFAFKQMVPRFSNWNLSVLSQVYEICSGNCNILTITQTDIWDMVKSDGNLLSVLCITLPFIFTCSDDRIHSGIVSIIHLDWLFSACAVSSNFS